MAILKVARLGHPVLRTVARPLTRSEIRGGDVQRLIDDMIATMHEYEGVGLAAPQVHASVRLALVEVAAVPQEGRAGLPLTIILNPVVTALSDEKVGGWEGCLSLPGLRGFVLRAPRVRLEALDRQARPFTLEAEGFSARVIQHECDHLDGIVYVDRMDDLKTLACLAEFERFVGAETGANEE